MSNVTNCCEGCEHFEPDPYKLRGKPLCCGRALRDGKFVVVDHSKYNVKNE